MAIPSSLKKEQKLLRTNPNIEESNGSILPTSTSPDIDSKKAIDSIDRETMWKIVRNYRIPKKIVNATAVIYSSSKSKVRLGEKLSEAIHITTGVLQGDTLAPFKFTIALDYILK